MASNNLVSDDASTYTVAELLGGEMTLPLNLIAYDERICPRCGALLPRWAWREHWELKHKQEQAPRFDSVGLLEEVIDDGQQPQTL